MAVHWAGQPARPPSSSRQLLTPAARALLRAHDIDLDAVHSRIDLRIVRLADAHALVSARSAAGTRHGAADTPDNGVTWAAVDVCLPVGQDPLDRLARATSAAIATLRGSARQRIRVAVTSADATVVLDAAEHLSISGIRRRLADRGRPASHSAPEVDLHILDGSASEATRLLPARTGAAVVGLGAPTRRVVPVPRDDEEVIAIRTVAEIWAAGGNALSPFDTAHLVRSVADAIEDRSPR
jgi:hypothetical protein